MLSKTEMKKLLKKDGLLRSKLVGDTSAGWSAFFNELDTDGS